MPDRARARWRMAKPSLDARMPSTDGFAPEREQKQPGIGPTASGRWLLVDV